MTKIGVEEFSVRFRIESEENTFAALLAGLGGGFAVMTRSEPIHRTKTETAITASMSSASMATKATSARITPVRGIDCSMLMAV